MVMTVVNSYHVFRAVDALSVESGDTVV